MSLLIELIGQYGIALVFACVLVEQIGVPLPAYPVLLVAGSMVAGSALSAPAALASAVVASLIADTLWFAGGRRYGRSVLRLLCRLSITPDSCVRQTDSIFTRWGPRSLMLAKFVPGFASMATVMAGATGVRTRPFLLYSAIGATLWAGIGLALGHLFAPAVADVLQVLQEIGKWAPPFLAACLAFFIAIKASRRYRFRAKPRADRITVDALAAMLHRGEAPLLVDVRSAHARAAGRIPGAIDFDDDSWPDQLRSAAESTTVVVYCDCPKDASATLIAKKLMKRGFKRARPLAGGIRAWQAAGMAIVSS